MMDYGVTKNGFVLKRGDDIINSLKKRLAAAFDVIDLSDQSVNMVYVGIFAEPLAEAWEKMKGVYDSQYPNSSEGQSLDYVCEFNAIKRLDKKVSVSVLAAKGVEQTSLDTYLMVGVANNQSLVFKSTESVKITVSKTNKMIVSVTTVLNNTSYIITVNSHTVGINSGAGATAISIAKAMHDEINILTALIDVQAELPTIENGTFTILSNNTNFSFNAVPDGKFTITDFWTPIRTECTTVGKIGVNAGQITNIITPVAGLTSVVNLKDAEEGRDIEIDPVLRLRRRKNVRVVGAGTIESMRARVLQQVEGVKQALVYENHEDIPDGEGRPPHSVECLVSGGTDIDIAKKLWEVKSGGIKTYGNASYTIYDSMGNQQTIYFSRPVEVYIWMKISLTVDSLLFPADGNAQITNGILETAIANFGIGDDVLIQKFFCPIYSVAGVTNALVEIAKTYDLTPPVSYVTTNIVIDEDEASNFDSSRINIIIP